mmetsp:Transcript_9178/g.12504  ORF Transcript_9178/g.12504 Transcript_9178/m.12504 type:complete len:205 (+) Transcript_9178:321-935(+)
MRVAPVKGRSCGSDLGLLLIRVSLCIVLRGALFVRSLLSDALGDWNFIKGPNWWFNFLSRYCFASQPAAFFHIPGPDNPTPVVCVADSEECALAALVNQNAQVKEHMRADHANEEEADRVTHRRALQVFAEEHHGVDQHQYRHFVHSGHVFGVAGLHGPPLLHHADDQKGQPQLQAQLGPEEPLPEHQRQADSHAAREEQSLHQ